MFYVKSGRNKKVKHSKAGLSSNHVKILKDKPATNLK